MTNTEINQMLELFDKDFKSINMTMLQELITILS